MLGDEPPRRSSPEAGKGCPGGPVRFLPYARPAFDPPDRIWGEMTLGTWAHTAAAFAETRVRHHVAYEARRLKRTQ